MRVRIDGVRPRAETGFEQAFDDVDGLVEAWRYEVAEDCDVVVGDMTIGHRAHAAVAEVQADEQVLLVEVVLGAIGRDFLAVAPELGQLQPQIQLGQVAAGLIELVQAHVPAVHEGQLVGRDAVGEVARGLARAEVAAHGEHGEQLTLARVAQFRVVARLGPEMTGEACPVLDVGQHIEQVAVRHPCLDRRLQGQRRRRHLLGRHALEDGLTLGADHHVLAQFRKGGVHLRGGGGEQLFEGVDEAVRRWRNADALAVRRQLALAVLPGQQLLAVVGERLGAFDANLAALEVGAEVAERAHLQHASVRRVAEAAGTLDQLAPAFRREAQIDHVGDPFRFLALVGHHGGQRVKQPTIRRRRLEVQRLGHAEHRGAVGAERLPQQRQMVAAAPHPDGGTVLSQPVQIALGRQQIPHPFTRDSVVEVLVQDVEYIAERRHELLAHFPLLGLGLLELLARMLVDQADALDEHLGDVVAGAHAHAADQGQHEGVPLGGPIAFELAGVQHGRAVRHVAQLRLRHAFEKRIAVRQRFQPSQLAEKEVEVLAGCLLGGTLDPVVEGLAGFKVTFDEAIQPFPLRLAETLGDALVQRLLCCFMDLFGDQHEGAEARQLVSTLDEIVDQDVDDIGARVDDLASLERNLVRFLPGSGAGERPDAEESPDGLVMPVERPVRLGIGDDVLGQHRKASADVAHDLSGNRSDVDEMVQVLEAFELHEQSKAAVFAAGKTLCPVELFGGRCEGCLQVLQRDRSGESGICGPLNRCHGHLSV
mmetsp:Transcript_53305/g.125288  ORF Transcript_53305/g.125288 Transcript_53305/m.125288 type:complete len:764 (-) Transcript_53305:163-2454(-)